VVWKAQGVFCHVKDQGSRIIWCLFYDGWQREFERTELPRRTVHASRTVPPALLSAGQTPWRSKGPYWCEGAEGRVGMGRNPVQTICAGRVRGLAGSIFTFWTELYAKAPLREARCLQHPRYQSALTSASIKHLHLLQPRLVEARRRNRRLLSKHAAFLHDIFTERCTLRIVKMYLLIHLFIYF
jgi:hypothetical protein